MADGLRKMNFSPAIMITQVGCSSERGGFSFSFLRCLVVTDAFVLLIRWAQAMWIVSLVSNLTGGTSQDDFARMTRYGEMCDEEGCLTPEQVGVILSVACLTCSGKF
mmetsp:Transcript_75971/g.203662  ORF Transcript_75971/g.203662 Transcript_75971/m.203662 type:complete len:107 (-) Transcript_75971:972-1292(-)